MRLQALVDNGIIVDWYGKVIYLVRPTSTGHFGGGQMPRSRAQSAADKLAEAVKKFRADRWKM